MMRSRTGLAAAVLACGNAAAQAPTEAPAPTTASAPASATEAPRWSFAATAYTYSVPDDRDYVQPTIMADRDWLHLEARYNYEDLDTGSAWFGCNFSFGEELTVEITPMVGAVFGDTNGVAPGYRGTLGWWQLELYSEGEYLFDTDDSSDSFFYTWSELAWAPLDWLRVGLVAQRTRSYETDLSIQRGLLIGFSFQHLDFTAYLLNPDESEPTFVLGVGLTF